MLKTISSIVFPLISFPYATRMLLVDSIGKVSFGLSIISYFSLLASLGISVYAIRECSRVRNDREKLQLIAGQIFTINVCSTLLSYFILGAVLLFASPLEDYRGLIIIQSLSIAASTLGADWVNTVFEDFRFMALRTVSFQVLSLALLFSLIHNPDDYLLYAGISVLSNSGAAVSNVIYRRKYIKLRLVWDKTLLKHLGPIMVLFGVQVSQVIFVNSDMTILGIVKGDGDAGIYSLAVNVYTMVNTTIASIAWVVMPRVTQALEVRDYDKLENVLSFAAQFIVTFGMPCVVGMLFLGQEVVWFFGGGEFAASVYPLRIFSLVLVTSLVSGFIVNIILIPSGRDNVLLVSSAASAVLNVILNVIFIPQFGYIAAAWTTFASEAIGLAIVLPCVDRSMKVSGLANVAVSTTFGCLGIVAISLLAALFVPHEPMRFFAAIIGSVVVYLAVLVVMRNRFASLALKSVAARLTKR